MVHINSAVFYKTKTLLEHSQLYSMKYSSTQGRYNTKEQVKMFVYSVRKTKNHKYLPVNPREKA